MDRVYDSGVSATPTDLPVAPETGYPIAGDPLTATPATKPGAYWFYMITESLRNLIVDAGLTPDHEDLTLLTDAVNAKVAPSASETVAGKAELATQAEALTGTDDARIMTPLKVTKLFSDTGRQSLGASGYQKLPGGLIIQWAQTVALSTSPATTTFPITFPSACVSVVLTDYGASVEPTGIVSKSTTGFSAQTASGSSSSYYIAMGY
jgi:hypothetical protein